MPENQLHEERVEIRVPAEDLDLWRRAAVARRMTLSAWIREQCSHAAIEHAVPRRDPHAEILGNANQRNGSKAKIFRNAEEAIADLKKGKK